MAPRHHRRGFDLAQGSRALAAADPQLGRWLQTLGPLAAPATWQGGFDVVDALARSIMFQQLSGKAAATIVGRVEACCGSTRLHAKALDAASDAALRACGLSAAKLLAVRDLCRRQLAGELPSARQMAWMEDEAIIQALLPVRGIGRWTAQMLLLFRLGRADVLPLDDLGVARGLQRVDGQQQLPLAAALAARGQCWSPWRSTAALALWRIADADSAVVDACWPR